MQSAAPANSSRSACWLSIDWQAVAFQAAMPILAMLAALLIGAVMLLLLKANPLEAYATMVRGVFGYQLPADVEAAGDKAIAGIKDGSIKVNP